MARKPSATEEDQYDSLETERRAQAALKRALNTPHKPHKPLKETEKESTNLKKKEA